MKLEPRPAVMAVITNWGGGSYVHIFVILTNFF